MLIPCVCFPDSGTFREMDPGGISEIARSQETIDGLEKGGTRGRSEVHGVTALNGSPQQQPDNSCTNGNFMDLEDPHQPGNDVILPVRRRLNDVRGDGCVGICVESECMSGDVIVDDSSEEIDGYMSTSSSSTSYCPSPLSSSPPLLSDCAETTVCLQLPLPGHVPEPSLPSTGQLLPPAEGLDPAATILEIQCTSRDRLDGQGQHVERFESRLTLGTALENGQVVSKRQYEESELKQRQQRTATGQELTASTQLYHQEQEKVTTTDGGQRVAETSVQDKETHESTEFTYQLVDGQKTRRGKTRRRSSTSSHNSVLRLGDELSLPASAADPQQPPEAISRQPRGWHTGSTTAHAESTSPKPVAISPSEEPDSTAGIQSDAPRCDDEALQAADSSAQVTSAGDCDCSVKVTRDLRGISQKASDDLEDCSEKLSSTIKQDPHVRAADSISKDTLRKVENGGEGRTGYVNGESSIKEEIHPFYNKKSELENNNYQHVSVSAPVVGLISVSADVEDLKKRVVLDTVAVHSPDIGCFTLSVKTDSLNKSENSISSFDPSIKTKYPTRMDTSGKYVVSFNSDSESDSDSSGISSFEEEVKRCPVKKPQTEIIQINGFTEDITSKSEKMTNGIISKSGRQQTPGDDREKTGVKEGGIKTSQANGPNLLDQPCLENGDWYQIRSSVPQTPATSLLTNDNSSNKGPDVALASAKVGTLIDINSHGVGKGGEIVVSPVASAQGEIGRPEPATWSANNTQQDQPPVSSASYSQELLAELDDISDQGGNTGGSHHHQAPCVQTNLNETDSKTSSEHANTRHQPSSTTADHHTDRLVPTSRKEENISRLAMESSRLDGEDIVVNGNVDESSTAEYSVGSGRGVTGGDDAVLERTYSPPPAYDDNDPESTENLIKRILEEARKDREGGPGRYRVNIGDTRDTEPEESTGYHPTKRLGRADFGNDLDADDDDDDVTSDRPARKYNTYDQDGTLTSRLTNMDKDRSSSSYKLPDYGSPSGDDLYKPRRNVYGQRGRNMYDDIDADSDVSSGRRRINKWCKSQNDYDDEEENVFLPANSRRPLCLQKNFDQDDEDDDVDSCPEPEPPLFTDEDFVPEKREETDEVVRERTYHVRSMVDHQSEVVSKLRRASQSFDELQDEIKELKQSLLESQLRRDAADTDIMDYAQSRLDQGETQQKIAYKPKPKYNQFDDEDFDEYSSGYKPKSKSKINYDADDPSEMDLPFSGKALGSLARNKYGGKTAYDRDTEDDSLYGESSSSYGETPSYANKYKPYSLGGANRFRRTHSLYDDIDQTLDDDDDDGGSSSGGFRYNSYKPKKYGSLDLESSPSRPFSASRYKPPTSGYTPSYRPSSYSRANTMSDYTSDLSTSPSASASSTPRYNKFSRSQTLSADYGSTLSTSTRPISPSRYEPETTSRFLKKVRDRKKANGEETSDNMSFSASDKPFRSRFMKKSFDSDYGSMGTSSRSSSMNTPPDTDSASGSSTTTERRSARTVEA